MGLQDAVLDALAGHVGQDGKEQLSAIRAGLAVEVVVQPVTNDGLELTEQMQLRVLVRVAVLGLEKMLGQMKQNGVVTNAGSVDEGEINALADDALVAGTPRAD